MKKQKPELTGATAKVNVEAVVSCDLRRKFIASTTNKKYGDVYIGFEKRDEEFIKKGYYKFNGGAPIELAEEVEHEYPDSCTAIHFADSDVQELFRIW